MWVIVSIFTLIHNSVQCKNILLVLVCARLCVCACACVAYGLSSEIISKLIFDCENKIVCTVCYDFFTFEFGLRRLVSALHTYTCESGNENILFFVACNVVFTLFSFGFFCTFNFIFSSIRRLAIRCWMLLQLDDVHVHFVKQSVCDRN